MGLETATYINGLVTTNPTSSDPKSQGDDHLRLVKSTVKATFPNITGAVTPTQTDLNVLAGAATGPVSLSINGTVGATTPAAVSSTALSYTTTLTGGTGIVNLGSGQFYKDASGNVGIGTTSPAQIVEANKSQDAKTQIKTTNTNAGVSASAGVLFGTSSGDNGYVGANGGAASSALGGANALQITNLSAAPIVLATNGTEKLRITSGGDVTVSTAALLGYGTGSGGTVTQATSKSTTVTLNKPTGRITMNNAALAAGATVVFNVANSLVTTTDIPNVSIQEPFSGYNYKIGVAATQNGSFAIWVTNFSGGSLSEAITINFALIKGATS